MCRPLQRRPRPRTRALWRGLASRLPVLALWILAGTGTVRVGQAQHGTLGLQPDKALSQYQLDHWTTDDGLPQNTVRGITRTHNGYLWLGTQEGLVRYDGQRFVVIDKAHSELPHNHVTALYEDDAGHLWVGTLGGGLVRIDAEDGHMDAYDTTHGLRSNSISAFVQDATGRLWIGTHDAGLHRLEGARILAVTDTLLGRQITALHRDPRGQLWVGTRTRGLFRLAGDRFVPVTSVPATDIAALASGADGRLWIGTRGEGLMALRGDTLTTFTTADGLPQNSVLALIEDGFGTLWIGTEQGGLARFRDGRFDAFDAADGLAHNVIRTLYADHEGSLWIGTDGGGLNRMWDGKFTTYTTREGLPSDMVFTVFEDRDGALWIGTEGGGVSRLHQGRITTLTTRDGLRNDVVVSLAQTPDGTVWIGTAAGLSAYRDGRFLDPPALEPLSGSFIYGLFTDRRGALWIIAESGLARLDQGHLQRWTTEDGLSSNLVTTLAEDPDGRLWVGTFDGGITVLQDGTAIAHFSTANGLPDDYIVELYADAEGAVWVGTHGNGLSRIDDGRIRTYTSEDGLLNDLIFQILEDDRGHLWMTSNRGLSSIAKADLIAYERGRGPLLQPHVYDRSDGLRSSEFNGGLQPAGWKDRQGRLWFGTTKGVAMIDPRHVRRNTWPPPVVLEAMRVDQQTVPVHSPVTLPPGRNKIEFRFAGLSLIAPERVRYRYRLEGYDATWTEDATTRTATYTNLPPGSYTFRVAARNADGVWSTDAASVTFYLEPFFYQTPWFLALAVASLVGLMLLAYRLRVRHLTARQRELEEQVEARTHDLRREKERTEAALREAERQREIAEEARAVIEEQADQLRELDRIKTRFFNNISHEFRTPLTLTIGPLENALTGVYGPLNEALHAQLSIMLRNARRLLRLINQLLDIAKLESDAFHLHARQGNIVPFLEGVVLAFTPFCERKHLHLTFEAAAEDLSLPFDPECMEKIVFNLLSNAVKFTPAGGRITVTVDRARLYPNDRAPEAVRLRVSDTGPGIPESDLPYIFDRFRQVDGMVSHVQEGTGIGLALVRELVELHGGAIEVTSTVGEGTCFEIRLPMVNDALLLAPEDAADTPDPSEPLTRGPLVEMAVFDADEEERTVTLDGRADGRADTGDDRPRVMIVDDNRDIRDYMIGCLQEHYRLLVAVDGQDALDQIRETPPDLILSDVMMPRLDGYALCRALKQDDDLRHIPLILLTARASIDDKIEGLEAGADDYLPKPFNARELLARVRNLLALRQHQQTLQQLNRELQASNEALQKASALKSQFLHMAAHDLKNPLNGIREIAAVVQAELTEEGRPHELLDLIADSANQMLELILRVLEAERLDSDSFALEDLAPVDLNRLALDVLRRNERQAERKGQRLVFHPGDADCRVEASEDWLGNAMDNLVSNAIKYAPHDTAITVSVERHGRQVRFGVRDQGPGISEEEQPRLFQKFERLSARPTGGESSTGLGLAIVKQIVEAHGGRVWVESRLGEGSLFVIELSALAPHPEPTAVSRT